jgi:hypothetical protein
MRIAIALIVAFGVPLSGIPTAVGDEPAAGLPTVGGWARYHAITKKDSGEEAANTMLLKSLTATTKDGVACRWFESEYWGNDEKARERRKFLIPEKAIQSTGKPSDEILVYLQQDNGDQVASVPPENQGWMPIDFLSFPGFLKDAEEVADPRTVKHQTGALEIPKAHVGTYKWSRKGQNPEEAAVWETKYRVWLHPDLPAGFAHAQATLTILNKGIKVRSWDLEYALQEFGGNAKAVIVEESAPPIRP